MLVDEHGSDIIRDKQFSQEDAEMLRHYKKSFLERHGYRERLWCAVCAEAGRPEGLRATVLDDKIDFMCRCTVRRYRGKTY